MLTGQQVPFLAAAFGCAVAAAWLVVDGRRRGLRRARLVLAGGGVVAAPPSGAGAVERWRAALRARPEWFCLVAAGLVAMLGGSPLPLVAGAVAVPLAGRSLRAARLGKEREERADAVVALCGTLAGELRAGRQPGPALCFAAGSTGALGPDEAAVLAAARFGGDVAGALRRAAGQGGADGLAGLAACWQVAVDGGAGLAAGLDRLEGALREVRDRREALRARLAGTWATVAVLAVLPVAGLLLGTAMGASPLRVLLHTPAGLACLVTGLLLEGAGLRWATWIVRKGEAA
ncbi:type II secretion system F family protein [Streptomyces solicathayae]|uniref:Type II secretion system F family protein n=1 Tax=Streptomyces solicathayae TaxID=3081768 RepID=A0ABZ0LU09_9ACTN|nr:type II secretion system F family protein [Streptomyces sp. HUAS YS2]WOX22991.1 type II secretion system F family protein [Streptomyces sp. HUAS YS2]